MLADLVHDHRGTTACFYLDVPFAETPARHATKSGMDRVGEAELRAWWQPDARMPGGLEEVIDHRSTLEESVGRVLAAIGPSPGRPRGRRGSGGERTTNISGICGHLR
jgi:hypothetical protein